MPIIGVATTNYYSMFGEMFRGVPGRDAIWLEYRDRNMRRWLDAIKERPACRRGVEVPVKPTNMIKDEKAAKEFTKNAGSMLQR